MPTSDPTRAARPYVVVGRLLDLALFAVIAVGLTSVLLGRVMPAIGHPVYVVAGPSMVPALTVGTAVVLDQVPPERLSPGDIVSLVSGPGRAVFTHRITRIVEDDGQRLVETRGDANANADPSLTPVSGIIGRVGVAVPYAGYVLAFLSTVSGLVIVVSSGALLLLLGWWVDGIGADRRRAAIAGVVDRRASVPAAPVAAPAVPALPELEVEPVVPLTALDLVRADPRRRQRRRRADHLRARP